jgi:5-methylthioadenosine/S-adenosylhomocysteine deaminase
MPGWTNAPADKGCAMTAKTPSLTRRAAVKAGAGLALAQCIQLACVGPVAGASPVPGLPRPPEIDPRQRLLLKGGTLVTMDPGIGNLDAGDVLIEGTEIAAVGRELAVRDVQTLDARNMIVLPGFVDCHRHSWEGQLRRINPNARTLAEYANATHLSFATHYRPEDMYAGAMITALGCIDAGITCVIDNSHNARSAEHSDAAVEALFDSGIRAVHASGAPQAGEWDRRWPRDLERLQRRYFSSGDGLVTLRMFSPVHRDNWAWARQLSLRITTEFQGPQASALILPLWRDGLVGPDNCFNHCGALTEGAWQILKDSGATINVCPRSDAQYGLGEGISAYQHALDRGLRPGFSVDNETSYGGDMFAEMRVAFHMQRALLQNRRYRGETNLPAPVGVRDVLECATVHGAACAGLEDRIGAIRPGMQADLILIRADDINLYPSNNALGAIVQAAERSNVDTVIIGGRIRKRGGGIVGLDMDRLKRLVEESRRYLFARTNYREDMFAESLPKLY